MRMSSWVAALIAIQEGLEPNYQMVCRDRNRIAMQSDILELMLMVSGTCSVCRVTTSSLATIL